MTRESKIKEGDTVSYYAQPNGNEPYSGPFAGRVVKVHEPTKAEPGAEVEHKVDIVVHFSETTEHSKTGVPYVLEPRRHACGPAPEGYTYDNWYAKLAEKAAAEQEQLAAQQAELEGAAKAKEEEAK